MELDDLADVGEPVKERVARQAVFASPLPPPVKYALLALIRWLYLNADLRDIADYAELDCEWMIKVMTVGLECVRTNLRREGILHVAQLPFMGDDPDRPDYLEEDCLRNGIFQSGLTLPAKLILLAMVESRGVSARPRQGAYTNGELAEFAGATGLSVEAVESILSSLRDEPCLVDSEAAEDWFLTASLLQHWNLPSASPDD